MPDPIGRRSFLGQAAAGAATAGVLAASAQARVRGANERVVVGVMGLSRGRSLAVSFAKRPNVEVKYVCDADAARAENGKRVVAGVLKGQSAGIPAPQAITDFRKILDDKSVDALVCAAPNHWHGPATIMACGAGKHVYVEKPCSHNPAEGEMMIQAARKNRRAVQMGSQRRSGPRMIEAMQRLHEGVIGHVYLSRAYYNSARGPTGKCAPAEIPSGLNYELWQGPAPRMPYMSNRVHYKWHWFWHWGNGELGNNGVHTLDLCRWGLNVDFPIRVSSSGGRYVYQDDQQTPDTHTVGFDFPGRKSITWQGLSCSRHGREAFVQFIGDKGSMDLAQDGSYRIYDHGDKLREEQKASSRGDIEHIDNLLAAIRNETPLKLNAEIAIGHRSTLLCHLGNIAHRTHATLQCNPKDGHILQASEAATKLWSREYDPNWTPKV